MALKGLHNVHFEIRQKADNIFQTLVIVAESSRTECVKQPYACALWLC